MTYRGYSYVEAFKNSVILEEEDGIHLHVNNKFGRSLIERTDSRGDVAYGVRHTPGANVKLFNSSKIPEASIAMSFETGRDMYDDVFKVVQRPSGGYDLHLNKINGIVYDGKRVDLRELSRFL